jgi:hypothetical protein
MMVRSVALLAIAGCGFQHGVARDASVDDDADTMADAQIDAARLGTWGTPTLVFPAGGDDDPTATSDLLELYFNRGGDYYLSRRASIADAWSLPARDDQLSSSAADTTPEVSADGLTMFLASQRAPSMVNDIWIATRTLRSDPWSTPVRVAELSSAADEYAPTPTPDRSS